MADDEELSDAAFLAEVLQHLRHSTVRQVVEEALREYVGDGEGADWLVLAAHDRETAARAWDEGYEAGVNDQVNWDGYHGYPPGYERHENPYREEADR